MTKTTMVVPIPADVTIINYVGPNILMTVCEKGGKMISCYGNKVKAELIELNHVKVVYQGEAMYAELGDDLRWLEV